MATGRELCRIGKRYGETVALTPTDLSVAEGDLHPLLGPSGSGKTTLLRPVGGFTAPA